MHGTQSVGQPAVESSDILQAELDHEWREYKDTHLEPVDFTALVQEAERTLLRAQAAQHPSQYPSGGNPANAAPAPAQSPALAWPPGNAGLIAQVIYNSSLRPVKEVSITATLGLLAGVCGRAWTLPKSGLNLYVVLIARSAIGKEAMHDGISMFIRGASKYFPQVSEFFDFNEYASGPALVKALAASPCFCFTNVSSEFGRKLKKMKNGKDDASQSLRTQMTNLYHKSGRTSIAGGISYSNTQNNVSSTVAIAYSMIGES
ncbi:TPA: hypothetical protein L4S14_005976, partial [Pseudomonas aeruginosa]|nr:hypothetical protein [Pseudomonas aeruginosa]